MKKSIVVLSFIALLGLCHFATLQSALAAKPDTLNAEQAFQHFGKAAAGDKKHTRKALAAFKALHENSPNNPLYLCYLGASYTLLGRDGWNPLAKLDNTEKGLDLIDKAVAKLSAEHDLPRSNDIPISVATRLSAVSTYLGVPGFFHRKQAAYSQAQLAIKTPNFTQLPAAIRAQLYLLGAKAAERNKHGVEAQRYLQGAIDSDPQSPQANEARHLQQGAQS